MGRSQSPEAQLPWACAGRWLGHELGGRAEAGKVGKDQGIAELASHTKKLKTHLRANWESPEGVKQESD